VRAATRASGDCIYSFHFANGTLQPVLCQVSYLERVDPSNQNAPLSSARQRSELVLSMLERRLAEAPYLAVPPSAAAASPREASTNDGAARRT